MGSLLAWGSGQLEQLCWESAATYVSVSVVHGCSTFILSYQQHLVSDSLWWCDINTSMLDWAVHVVQGLSQRGLPKSSK